MYMDAIFRSWARAFTSQFRFKIILLSLIPVAMTIILWLVFMSWRFQTIIDFFQEQMMQHDSFTKANEFLLGFGLLALKTVVVPLMAMWLLLPIMMITALLFVTLIIMPVIGKIIGEDDYPQVERKGSNSVFNSLLYAVFSFILFGILWVLTIPLLFIPVVYVFVHPILWGWLTYRLMTYDALTAFATNEERHTLVAKHRWSLILVGTIAGWVSTLPSVLWMGGIMSSMLFVALFPIFVCLAIWIYLIIAVYSGLWFQHYCLDALEKMRIEQQRNQAFNHAVFPPTVADFPPTVTDSH